MLQDLRSIPFQFYLINGVFICCFFLTTSLHSTETTITPSHWHSNGIQEFKQEVDIGTNDMNEITKNKDDIYMEEKEMKERRINEEIMKEGRMNESVSSAPMIEYVGEEVVDKVKKSSHLVLFRLKTCIQCDKFETSLASLSSLLNKKSIHELIFAKVVCLKGMKKVCGNFNLKSFPLISLYDQKNMAVRRFVGREVVMLVNGLMKKFTSQTNDSLSTIVDLIMNWKLKEEDDGREEEVKMDGEVYDLSSSNFHSFISHGEHVVMLYAESSSYLPQHTETLKVETNNNSSFLFFSKIDCSKNAKVCIQYLYESSLDGKGDEGGEGGEGGDGDKGGDGGERGEAGDGGEEGALGSEGGDGGDDRDGGYGIEDTILSQVRDRDEKKVKEEVTVDDQLENLKIKPVLLLFENGILKKRLKKEMSQNNLQEFLTFSYPVLTKSTDLDDLSFERMKKGFGSLVRFNWGKDEQVDKKVWAYVLERVLKTNKEIQFGEIDCRKYEALCKKHHLKELPTITLYYRKKVIDTYRGNATSLSELFEFCDQIPLKLAKTHTPPQPHHHHPGENTKVYHLSEENFERISRENEFLFVNFVTTRCVECKSMYVTWQTLADMMWDAGDVVLGEVHCDNYIELCRTFEIRKYPSVLLFHRSQKHSIYTQSYHLDTMLTFLQGSVNKIRREKKMSHRREDL